MPGQQETLVFDESGTALTGVDGDRVFIVGGFACSGDQTAVSVAWQNVLDRHGISRLKGARFGRQHMELLRDFVRDARLVPIASYSGLADSDEEAMKRKLRSLVAAGVPQEAARKMKAVPYLWLQQVSQTILPALLGSVAADHGPISFVRIEIDQYALSDGLKADAAKLFRTWLDPQQRFEPMLSAIESRRPGDPYFETLRAGIAFGPTDHEIVWTAKGALGKLADAIAGTYRRKVVGDRDAAAVWQEIETETRRPSGDLPSCVGLDLTSNMKALIHRPWPPRHGGGG